MTKGTHTLLEEQKGDTTLDLSELTSTQPTGSLLGRVSGHWPECKTHTSPGRNFTQIKMRNCVLKNWPVLAWLAGFQSSTCPGDVQEAANDLRVSLSFCNQ